MINIVSHRFNDKKSKKTGAAGESENKTRISIYIEDREREKGSIDKEKEITIW